MGCKIVIEIVFNELVVPKCVLSSKVEIIQAFLCWKFQHVQWNWISQIIFVQSISRKNDLKEKLEKKQGPLSWEFLWF